MLITFLVKKLRFLALFFMGLAVSAGAQTATDSVGTADEEPYFILMGEADRAIAQGNWTEAVARLSDVIAVSPDNHSNALVYCNLGACYGYLEEDSLALDAYDKSLAIAPCMLTALVAKGRQLLVMNRDREAYDAFSTAIEVDSLSQSPRYYRGMMALYGGNRDVAEADFDVLRSQAPADESTATALAALYSMTGRDMEALPYLRRLIAGNPQPEYYASLAGCYLALERLTDASEVIGEAMEKYPADPELYYYRAWLNRDRYMLSDARRDAAEAIRLGASPRKVNALFVK